MTTVPDTGGGAGRGWRMRRARLGQPWGWGGELGGVPPQLSPGLWAPLSHVSRLFPCLGAALAGEGLERAVKAKP